LRERAEGEEMRYVGLILARAGSKRLPGKNVKPICGRPLIFWVLDAAVEALRVVYVMTDSPLIASVIEQYKSDKVKVIGRDKENAQDGSSSDAACVEFAELVDFENLVLLQATSPLTKAMDVTNAIQRYEAYGYDSLISVVEQRREYWHPHGKLVARSMYDNLLVENGAIYITSKEALISTRKIRNGYVGYYTMPKKTYFEIDTQEDFELVEAVMRSEGVVSESV
jgi:CMP-N-acetylneuraminic acid synthetase